MRSEIYLYAGITATFASAARLTRYRPRPPTFKAMSASRPGAGLVGAIYAGKPGTNHRRWTSMRFRAENSQQIIGDKIFLISDAVTESCMALRFRFVGDRYVDGTVRWPARAHMWQAVQNVLQYADRAGRGFAHGHLPATAVGGLSLGRTRWYAAEFMVFEEVEGEVRLL